MGADANSRLIEALEQWAENHSRPDDPVLHLLGESRHFSPADIVREVRSGSSLGEQLLELFEYAARKHSIEAVIDSLESETRCKFETGEAFTA